MTLADKAIELQPREIRIFLSSTFKDMDVERNHLMKQVFPKIRAACLARQVGFTEIDLRWGVTEEESMNGATVEICLAEIDRCRDFPPFFIGFVGERYGWIPKDEDLAAYWQRHAESAYANPIRQAVKRGISVTELEMELGVLGEGAAENIHGHALFLLRDPTLTDSLYQQATGKPANPADPSYYDPAGGQLVTLKERIRQTSFLGVDGYTSIEQFGQTIEDYLLAQLNQHFPESDIPSPLQRLQEAHAAFRFHRLQNLLPRPDVRETLLNTMQQRIERPSLGPILLAGPSGQGKSALMADLARHLETDNGNIHWRVIDHYVGADEQNSLDSWLKRLLETLYPEIEDLTGPVPESPKDRKEALSTWIAMAARRMERNSADQRPVRFALVLDALDQLGDGGKDLDLLKPETLGPDSILVVSAADGTPAKESAGHFTTVDLPPLTATLKAELIQGTLKRYRKTLPDDLAKKLAIAPQSGSPLYLTLALEELRLDASHESLGELLTEILQSPDAAHLFLHRFLLDEDYGRPEAPTLAVDFMALLGASRNGLTEIELADLLALPDDPVAADTKKPRLPQVYLSRLLNAFQPFLLNKQGNRAPMHRILGHVALETIGSSKTRQHMLVYFRVGYGLNDSPFDSRFAAECLYQNIKLIMLADSDQDSFQKLLGKDVGFIAMPIALRLNDQRLVIEALDTLNDEQTIYVSAEWTELINGIDAETADGKLFSDFGSALCSRGIHSLALAVLEPLMERKEKLFSDNLEDIANTSIELGWLYFRIGKFENALPRLKRAVDIYEQLYGLESTLTASAIGTLGELLRVMGSQSESESYFRLSISVFEKLGDHESLANALNNLAMLQHDRRDIEAAVDSYQRALFFSEMVDVEGLMVARCLNNLATLSMERNDFSITIPLLKRSMKIWERFDHNADPEMAICKGNLAYALAETGSYENVSDISNLIDDVVFIHMQACPEHPDTPKYIDHFAQILDTLEETEQAAALRGKAAFIRSINSPTTHLPTQGETSMRLTDTLKQWLTEQEWKEEPEIDEEKQTSSTGFGFTVGDFNLQCWFEINEKAEVFKLYAYFLDTKVPEKKLDEVQKFVTAVSNGMMLGSLHLLQEKRTIRYYSAIDVENAAFEPAHITNLFNAGMRTMDHNLPRYMAICFGGKTADEALEIEN
jgi:tetratricopeptide (TPR) repeat protein